MKFAVALICLLMAALRITCAIEAESRRETLLWAGLAVLWTGVAAEWMFL